MIETNKNGPSAAGLAAVLLVVYLLLPMLAILIYSVAGKWDRSVLPEDFTGRWFAALFTDPRFYAAMGRSLLLCGAATAVSVVVTVPAVYAVMMWKPQWERGLAFLTVLPYGMPGVVAAVGLLKVYSKGPIAIAGTPWIVLGSYVIGVLPYLYQSISNSLKAMSARSLTESAYLLGADPWKAFLKVIVPGMAAGTASAAILSFSVLFGEFVLANLLIGGKFETIQMYLYRRQTENGHVASAVVVVYLVVIAVVAGVIMRLSRRGRTEEGRES